MGILIVDDEEIALHSVRRLLNRRGYRQVEICAEGGRAIELIRGGDYDLVFLDLLMPEVGGMEILQACKPHKPGTEFIMLTAVDDLATAVKATRLGAFDYLVKPVENERLLLAVERAFERRSLRRAMLGGSGGAGQRIPAAFAPIVSQCPRIRDLLASAEVMARSGSNILVTGDSGTGKELLARGIHLAGPNPNGPYIPVNVAAIPATIFESQFFGHTRGAFTGANEEHPGFFGLADGGTLFLDEIGELPLPLQTKFLRVLEEKSILPLGARQPRPLAVQVVSATNADLDQACREGRFRLDLLYRLNPLHLHLPPLRERPGDIPLLARHFLAQAGIQLGKEFQGFTPEALAILDQLDYPGNIRQLAQVITRAALQATPPLILPQDLVAGPARPTLARALTSFREDSGKHLLYVLQQTRGDRQEAARILDVSLRQVQRRLLQLRQDPNLAPLLDGL